MANVIAYNCKCHIDVAILFIVTHSQREAYMDLFENGGGGRQEIEEPQGML